MKVHYWPLSWKDAACKINRHAEDDFDTTTELSKTTCQRCLNIAIVRVQPMTRARSSVPVDFSGFRRAKGR